MGKIEIKLNLSALNVLMRSAPVQAEIDRIGREGAAEAGEGFEYVPKPHKYTARGFIQTANPAGARRQARDAILERIISRRSR